MAPRSLFSPPTSSRASSSLTLPVAEDVAQDLLQPQDLLPHAPSTDADNLAKVAPWLEEPEPPTPPPKSQRFGFSSKPSFSSFSLPRQPSTSNLSLSRPSETQSIHSISSNADTVHTVESRRSKSSLNILSIMKKRSRSRLRSDTRFSDDPIPPLPTDRKSVYSLSMPPSPPPPSTRKDKGRLKKKSFNDTMSPPVPENGPLYALDTDLDRMDGIIDISVLPPAPDSGSPGSGFESSHQSSSSVSSMFNPATTLPTSTIFSNPNPFSALCKRSPGVAASFDARKVSPKTCPPDYPVDDCSPSWTAPESWAVEKEGEGLNMEYSSSEDSTAGLGPHFKRRRRRNVTASTSGRPVPPPKIYKLRIYRANNAYHIVSIDLDVTVAELTPLLNEKFQLEPAEAHRLYLKERGRERVLAATERPANIVRRRLEQAGYDVADGLDTMGADDIHFLMKFVYKSNVLGRAQEELHLDTDTFDRVELTGRSLRTVPVQLYVHAENIILLNLSRNPMLEIPLDFIQACTTLRELRLQHMAMKKVPQSIRHCRTLHRLDLSCNRIVDLDDAGLDHIPELRSLKVQNNRMEKLPWYFPRLRALKDLNISNNHFRHLHAVVSEITSLVDLDISFNMIAELPEEIGQLHNLERLIIVGNQVTKFPENCRNLCSLRMLDCRRNHISDLSIMCTLPKLEQMFAENNATHALDLSFGPALKQLDASHNDITQLSLVPGPVGQPYALTSLDVSHAKLSALDDRALAQLTALETLRIDHNSIRFIPDTLGTLASLVHISCSNNQLLALPVTIGRLQRLETLEAHNNSLEELPASLWNCSSLQFINVTSNLIGKWKLPHVAGPIALTPSFPDSGASASPRPAAYPDRKPSSSGSISGRAFPPLAFSLEKLYLGENRLTDDLLHPLALLKELRVLNLSFNDIQEMAPAFFRNLTQLKELYLSGNKLSSIPTEDLFRLTKLEVLFLNGNKLQTLPHELSKISSLSAIDVSSNVLKYNINNWEFDWNWNFNPNLRYLNLSGNKRLEIKPPMSGKPTAREHSQHGVLSDFSGLTQLRILGLMDVTLGLTNIPDENEDRRIRTSLSEVNGMGYGIADTLGVTEHLNMLDLVQPRFRDRKNEVVFAMFGRSSHVANSHFLNKFLHAKFLEVYTGELSRLNGRKGEGVPDALRRAFLRLNKLLHDHLYSSTTGRKMSHVSASTTGAIIHDISSTRSGASGVVLHIVDRTLHVANAGNALAVISRQGVAELLSRKHDPFDRLEIARIRAAEGWVSPKGCVNDEIDVARSFGFFNLLPVVNARPDIYTWELSDLDEFIIVGNSGLWDHVSYQTAVDIARSERADPMIAAQKLRDFAISYGAEGTTMIMVISVANMFDQGLRSRQPTMDSVMDTEAFLSRRKKRDEITNRDISRLDDEVSPPMGHLALVFTDIRNSTHLWEVNAGMATAMVLHNNLLRRQLRFCGGYEVKTEGDAFMCSFPTALAALWWGLNVQVQLLHLDWPLEILECEDGKEVFDSDGKLVARGLSVRMGIHCGHPVCEPDPITHRMDYFGPMVNRSARISGSAAGGQIMCSADIIRELRARIFEAVPHTEHSSLQPAHAVDAIRRLGVVVVPVGEVKLKGLEVPENLSLVYPAELAGRQTLDAQAQPDPNAAGSRVQFSVAQMRDLALLCVRLEALSASRVFRPTRCARDVGADAATVFRGDPKVLLPMMDNASDAELLLLLDSLTLRVQNALTAITLNRVVAAHAQAQSVEVIQQLLATLSLPTCASPA